MLFAVLFVIGGLGLIVYGLCSLLSGEQVPLNIVVYFFEIDLPNGGQIVPILGSCQSCLAML
jgi:hypothetical protein